MSCFGDDGNTDSGDVWKVEWEGAAAAWQRDAPVRLRHRDTGAFLANHNVKYQRPIPGHTEVIALREAGPKAVWIATEGVYIVGREEH